MTTKTMLLIVLAAVVVAILIYVFLNVRFGRADDRSEPLPGPRDRPRDRRASDGRRSPAETGRPTRATGQRAWGEADANWDRVRGESQRERGGGRAGDAGYSQPRAGRREDAGDYAGASARRVSSAQAERGPSRARTADRPAGGRRGGRDSDTTHRSGRAYDRGPRTRVPDSDFPSGEFPSDAYQVADFPSDAFPADDFPSGAYPAADHPSGPFPGADFPSGAYPAADHPSGPFPGADYPSGPYPATGYPTGPHPASRQSREVAADGPPSGDYPAVAARKTPERGGDASRGRGESRRKVKAAQSARSRSKQSRGKRDDDDDWPSTEWDKLSDEQYWAELSADKPLASTARSAQPATPAAAEQVKDAPAQPAPDRSRAGRSHAPGRRSPATPSGQAPAPPVGLDDSRDSAVRDRQGGRRDGADGLPARTRQPQGAPSGSTQPTRPVASAPHGAAAAGLSRDNRAAPDVSGGRQAAVPRVPLDDDPLTSPSFSRRSAPVSDSRSYGSSRARQQGADPDASHRRGAHAAGTAPAADGAYPDGNGYGPASGYSGGDGYGTDANGSGARPARYPVSGGYPVPGGYRDEQPAGTSWYPPEPTAAHGNPYPGGYPGSVPSGPSPASPSPYGAVAGSGYDRYDGGAPSGYPEPAYHQEPAYQAPDESPYPQDLLPPSPLASPADYVPYPPGYPAGGYGPDQPAQPLYPGGYGDGYESGYADEQGGHPYPAPYPTDGYEGYPAQG